MFQMIQRYCFLFFGIVTSCSAFSQVADAQMSKIRLHFKLDEKGSPIYSVFYNNKTVIAPSAMGFYIKDGLPMIDGFEVQGFDSALVVEDWVPVWGEVKKIRNHYKQITCHLRQKVNKRLLDIKFRIFEDGVGFRYEFPKQSTLGYFIVSDERTEFNLTGDHKAFWIPGDFDTNEYAYTTSKLSEVKNTDMVVKSTDIAVRTVTDPHAVQTPLMMKSQDGIYINIHEAALINYPAMQLQVNNSDFHLTSSLVPDALGNKAYLHAPFNTPWRTIIVSDKATDILSSKLILNLNEPSIIQNTSWIKPMKFVGVWWELQTSKTGWKYSDFPDSLDAQGKLIPNGNHGANTANVKRYIDFAAAHGIKGVLVEGWNKGWEDWFGNWKENVFDFVTPYDDFNVVEIQQYAKSKGVQMIMHNETSGSATNYERQLDTAFRFMKKHGYNSVKTGYVGKIIPRGESHDGQWMINHYQRTIEKAAEHQVMIDIHEPARPTGMHRTYPNWIASEAARGNEYHAFSNGTTPDHVTILPFTRLMGGPMDYTPGLFKLRNYSVDSSKKVNSTLAKQLALYITIYSPLQMAADLPENYEAHMDAFKFIKDVPVDWDETKIIAAEPGDYVVIARKEKDSEDWYLGAVTDEDKRSFDIDLSFLNDGAKYEAIVYADGNNADWEKNPEAYSIRRIVVNNKSKLNLKLARGGGAAVSFKIKNVPSGLSK